VVTPLKSEGYGFGECPSWRRVLRSLRKRCQRFVPVDGHLINQTLNEFVSGIVARLKLSIETYALGLYIYYSVVLRKLGYSSNQLLYASVSLYLASKVVEKDSAIVNLTALKKAACSYIPKEEYTRAEKTILQLLDFNLELDTFVSFVNVYLWRGVLYSDEGQFDCHQLSAFEQGVLTRCSGYVRSGKYLQFQPERLAAYVVFAARKARGLEGWRDEISKYSEFSKRDIAQLVEEIHSIDSVPTNALANQNSNTPNRSGLLLQKKLNIAESRVVQPTDAPLTSRER
jgi:hypothetical protein